MRKGIAPFWIGGLLVAISAYPLFLMAREVSTGYYVGFRYRVTPTHASQTAAIGAHRISLADDYETSPDPSARIRGAVRILIDGRDYSEANGVEIRPYFHDENRYYGYLGIVSFTDHFNNESYAVGVQNLGVDPGRPKSRADGFDLQYLRFRVVMLNSDGAVREETFFYKDRGTPPVRAALVRYVSPRPMGFHSDLMMGWPTLFYPLLFPFSSGLGGVICLLVGIKHRRRQA
jgi:hypothetical protein